MYYFSKTLNTTFENALDLVIEALKTEGFGVLTQINIKDTLKKKIDVDFRKYVILGACNPQFAHQALESEDKIGVLLPCNVILQELPNGEVEVAAVDPITSMSSVQNEKLGTIAQQVQQKLKNVIKQL
ncbi:hypothetical protein W5A_09159 [Imtechella halotolerans K1]|uniref:DUF302 domain-containing protein n=2 Tax=Imtechella TaxID=1165076 RepID=I0WDC6_9FLAO|nr:hypothetical protein W5A_09159 [Imtechella halotolerans K1]